MFQKSDMFVFLGYSTPPCIEYYRMLSTTVLTFFSVRYTIRLQRRYAARHAICCILPLLFSSTMVVLSSNAVQYSTVPILKWQYKGKNGEERGNRKVFSFLKIVKYRRRKRAGFKWNRHAPQNLRYVTHSYREIGMTTPHLPQLLDYQYYRSQNFIGVSFSRDWQFGVYSRLREQGRWAGAFLVSISIVPVIFLLCVTCRCWRGTESLQQLGELCRSGAHWHSGAYRVRFCERSTARSVITHIFQVLSGKHITLVGRSSHPSL